MSLEIRVNTEIQNSSEILEVTEREAITQHEKNQPLTYTIFVSDHTKRYKLISSTFERYNDTVANSLKKDLNIMQQDVNINLQTGSNNFFRNAKWSPDGSYILTNSADDVIRLFPLPTNVYEDSDSADDILSMEAMIGIREGESVYDFDWYPLMTAQDPSTLCFITSVRDHPIQLWDITTGAVRASYRAIDHCERFIGPNVVSFNLDGSKIYCGYENMIEIFDSHTGESFKCPSIPKRKSRKGQKGILSCIDFSTDGLYAVGSYSQSIGIYDETNNELCLKLNGFEGGGVTQVKFSKDGIHLFSASRHADSILCWDIRNTANTLYELPRFGRTNQRIQFDLDASGQSLITGDTNGNVSVYDISTSNTENIETKQRLAYSFQANKDIVSCATFNPVYPVVATCSGQRKFISSYESDSSGNEEEVEDEVHIIDNSLKTWRIPGKYEWFSYEGTVLNVQGS